jgi:hypothetical protein
MGLDRACLRALQAAHQTLSKSGAVAGAVAGAGSGSALSVVASSVLSLVASLEGVFKEQSGAAFSASAARALGAVSAMAQCAFHRHLSPDGELFYSRAGGAGGAGGEEASQWEAPPAISAAMKELLSVDRITRALEDEAVPAVPGGVVAGIVAGIVAHAHDPGVVGLLLGALAKMAANPDNHAAIAESGALRKVADAVREHGHLEDARVCEALAALVLPLSFDPPLVRRLLAPSGIAALLVAVADKYARHLTSFVGSAVAWLPDGDAAAGAAAGGPGYNASLRAWRATGVADADERNRALPRVAQCCAQSIANIACDSEPDEETGRSMVDALVGGATHTRTHSRARARIARTRAHSAPPLPPPPNAPCPLLLCPLLGAARRWRWAAARAPAAPSRSCAA